MEKYPQELKSDIKSSLSIVILGTRGIPAKYGGFETFAQEISILLQKKGHKVTVFNRRFLSLSKNINSSEEINTANEVKVEHAFTIANKYLETPIHALFSNLKLIIDKIFYKKQYDVALLCNCANAPFAFLLNLINLPLVINVDGIERHRTKWNRLGKLWYLLGEWCATKFANQIVSDAKVIQEYYWQRYKTSSVMIPYGANIKIIPAGITLEKFNLEPKKYILYVSRLEPENNALGVIQAFKAYDNPFNLKLVIVGDAPYANSYKERLYVEAFSNVIFTGFQFGDSYFELQSNCLIYIQATEVGGTHPALVEAMAFANPIIVNGTEENIEVVEDCALIFEKNNFNDLTKKIKQLVEDSSLRKELGMKALVRVKSNYNWDKIGQLYESLLISVSSS